MSTGDIHKRSSPQQAMLLTHPERKALIMGKSTRTDDLAEEVVDVADELATDMRENSDHIREITRMAIALFAQTTGSDLSARVSLVAKAVRNDLRTGGMLSNGRQATSSQIDIGVQRAEDILHGARRIVLGNLHYDEVIRAIDQSRAQRRAKYLSDRAEKRTPRRRRQSFASALG